MHILDLVVVVTAVNAFEVQVDVFEFAQFMQRLVVKRQSEFLVLGGFCDPSVVRPMLLGEVCAFGRGHVGLELPLDTAIRSSSDDIEFGDEGELFREGLI